MPFERRSQVGPLLLRWCEFATQFQFSPSIPNALMPYLIKTARGLSSPAVLIAMVWCVTLIGVAVGPINYPQQPSLPVLILVAIGLALFIAAYQGGGWSFRAWLRHRSSFPAPSVRILTTAVAAASTAGLIGISLIALDRTLLSDNGGSAELLRCAPTLVDFIEVKRTPLIYVGYLTFSFGFASLVLFVLRGEEIGGWAAILAQLSILSPVGYAVLYSGRMPILFVIVLIVAAVLARLRQGKRPLPDGHHLLIKMVVVLLLFGAYSSAMWSSRQAYCVQMTGLIQQLQDRMRERDLARDPKQSTPAAEPLQEPSKVTGDPESPKSPVGDRGSPAQVQTPPPIESRSQLVQTNPSPKSSAGDRGPPTQAQAPPPSPDSISAADLSKLVGAAKAPPGNDYRPRSANVAALLATMQEAWHVKPRDYVLSAIESGRLSPGTATSILNTYFYLTHSVRILDLVWHARAQFTPHLGIYEVGVLSPVLRVFLPKNEQLAAMSAQLRSAEIYGFFPTAWAAAYIDFGATGAVIYILIWGFAAGWSAVGVRHSVLVTPALLLTFILASILLSPVQGPLGIANSALVLVSMVIVGLVIDFDSLNASFRLTSRRPVEPKAPA
jgi:hypothetical protein